MGLAMTGMNTKRFSMTTPAQNTTALNRSGLSVRDGVGIGLVFTGAGLAVFGFHQMHKEKRSAKTHSITFDFSNGKSEIQRSNEFPNNNTRHNHPNFLQ
jgi:hypothetical protein